MSTPDETLDIREKELESRIQMLERQLDRLNARINDDGAIPVAASPVIAQASPPQAKYVPADEMPELSEEVLGWASRNAVLPRLASVCFLMVVALVLRTITDSGIVNKLVGSGLGMGYAAVLMGVCWYQYMRQSPLAPVFAACGAILMATIVVETHTHFESLPLVPAYLTLMATGISMAVISRRFNAFTPISFGVLSMCFAGAAIDYPHPFFPYLALVLYTANVLGYYAALLKRCSWLRWSALVVTMVMLQLWGIQIGMAARKGGTIPPELAVSWFMPVMAVFVITYLVLSILGIVRSGTGEISRFDLSLPAFCTIWAFLAINSIMGTQAGGARLCGVIGCAVALCLFSVTFWLARRDIDGAPGVGSFTFAGGVLLAMALPMVTGALVFSLPIISTVAIFMAVMSRVWENGVVRVTTYIFHLYTSMALVAALRGASPEAMDAVNIIPAGLLSFIILYQYLWCRWWPPAGGSSFFSHFDNNDRSAALLLVAGLACGFCLVRIGFFQTLQMFPAAMQRDVFRCGQSVIINGAVIALVILAYLKRDKEVRNVAILVTVVGAIKVFLYDLLGTHGLPLVTSVFSFGMAAAIESIALGKWQKQPVGQRDEINEGVSI